MQFEKNVIYHIYNQGNNKQPIFYERSQYLLFLRKMRTHVLPYGSFLSWCLMPNHFHWQFFVRETELPLSSLNRQKPSDRLVSLNESIGIVLRSYTRALNKQNNWSGSLFRKETKAKDGFIDSFITVESKHWNANDYVAACFSYIHQNPVQANLVKRNYEWEFSSASDYMGKRKGTLCDFKLAESLGLHLTV